MLFNLSGAVFPSATLPFNGSLLPCGFDCTSVVHTKEEESASRVVTSVMGFVSMFTNLVAIVAYFLNRKKLRHAARRLNVYLNIVFVFGLSLDMMLAGFPSVATQRTCDSDGTLRRNEPNATEGLTLCVVFLFMHLLCTYIFYFVCVSMSHQWYLMLSTLDSLQHLETSERKQKRREIVYYILAAVASITMTVVSLARQVSIGHPPRGTCSLAPKDLFYVASITFFLVSGTTTVYLVLGLPKLHQVYNNVKLFPDQTAGWMHRSSGARRSSTHIQGVKSLLILLSVYIVVAVGSILIPLTYSYIFALSDGKEAATEKHIQCRLSRCHSAAGLCPPLPRLSIGLGISTEVYTGVIGLVFSAWAFNWRRYWKEHWTSLSNTVRQCYRTRTVWTLSNGPSSNCNWHEVVMREQPLTSS